MLAMLAAAFGWLMPVPAAIVQEVIDVAVILNALRALIPATAHAGKSMTAAAGRELHRNHITLIGSLDRLRSIVDALDDATPSKRRRADRGGEPAGSGASGRARARRRRQCLSATRQGAQRSVTAFPP